MFNAIDSATVAPSDVREGDVFTHDGKEYRATSDAEFVRSAGTVQVRAVDAYERVSFVELTSEAYDVAFVAEYAAS